MSNKIQIRRGTAAGRPTFDSGEPGIDTDAVRAWIGTTEGNRELQMKGSTTDYTIYVASSTYGGVPSSSGATGKPLLTGSADSGTSGTTLYDAAGTFTSAAHTNKAIYNATTGVWSKVASVSSNTNLTLSVSGSFAAGDTYVITNAFDNIPEAFNVADAGYNANITLRVSDGTFSNVLTLIGKTAGAAKTLTLQGSTTGTTTVSGETSIYQKISLKNITFTKRIFEYFGADVDWTTCVTSGDDGFLLLKSTSVANVFRTSSVIIFENDPAVYTSISSTVTKGYTIYVATSTYGGDDTVGDGLKITQGTATTTTANKLIDSTANFNSTDHLNKTLYNSTDDTWAKITAIDSTTQLSISADIMASGEAYVIANAVATVQKAIDLIPGAVNCNTTVRTSNGTYTTGTKMQGKALTGAYKITVEGTQGVALSSGTSTAANVNYSMGGAGSGAVQATFNDTGKAWGVNAYQNMMVMITGGTGSGQRRIIDSNTATQLKIVGYWDTLPDATSTYKIQDWATIFDFSGVAATSPLHGLELLGQQSVDFKMLKIYDWPTGSGGGEGSYYGIYAHDFASFSLYDSNISRTRTEKSCGSGIQIESYSVLSECKRNVLREITSGSAGRLIRYQGSASPKQDSVIENTKLDGGYDTIVIAAQSFNNGYASPTGNGLVIRNARRFGMLVNSFSRSDITASIITGSVTNNISISQFGFILLRSNNEISSAGADGIKLDGYGMISNIGSATQINNNGGWGVNAINLSYGNTVSTLSYTGNTSGTYTADASSKNT